MVKTSIKSNWIRDVITMWYVHQTVIVRNFLSQMFIDGYINIYDFYFILNLFLYHTNFIFSDELFKLIKV